MPLVEVCVSAIFILFWFAGSVAYAANLGSIKQSFPEISYGYSELLRTAA